MNREIKFRAWDYTEGKMIDWQSMQGWAMGSLNSGENKMQYTGLKDKNGKEIYEDDLITFQFYDERTNIWEKRNERVIWTTDRWTTDQTNYDLSMPSQYFEIIGNIYEHPELLKETSQ